MLSCSTSRAVLHALLTAKAIIVNTTHAEHYSALLPTGFIPFREANMTAGPQID